MASREPAILGCNPHPDHFGGNVAPIRENALTDNALILVNITDDTGQVLRED